MLPIVPTVPRRHCDGSSNVPETLLYTTLGNHVNHSAHFHIKLLCFCFTFPLIVHSFGYAIWSRLGFMPFGMNPRRDQSVQLHAVTLH